MSTAAILELIEQLQAAAAEFLKLADGGDFGVLNDEEFYRVHTGLNPSGIIPAGPDLSGWLTPHHREELGGRPFGDERHRVRRPPLSRWQTNPVD